LWRLKPKIHGLFPMLWIFDIQTFHKRMGFINIHRKNKWMIHIFSTIVGFSCTCWRILSSSIFSYYFRTIYSYP
jgi:hypothetical protein